MTTKHFMFDFETFGQDIHRCPVINCAVCLFDFDRFEDNPYTFEELITDHVKSLKLDVAHQVQDLGYKIEDSSLEFWRSLPKEVQDQVVPRKDDLKVDEFCDRLLEYLSSGRIDRWWSRGNNFDPMILMRLFDDCGKLKEIENILKFWLVRDERTYIDAMTGFKLKKNAFNPLDDDDKEIYGAHNSVHDVALGVMRIQYLEREAD